jgi:hypothetical protein
VQRDPVNMGKRASPVKSLAPFDKPHEHVASTVKRLAAT